MENSFLDINEYLFFSTFEEFLCPYFNDGRFCKFKVLIYYEDFIKEAYTILLKNGFRRVNSIFYKNICEDCNKCIPIRIAVNRFRPNKNQKRIFKKNNDIKDEVVKSEITLEKFILYSNYIKNVHKSKANSKNLYDEMECIHYGYSGTIEMDYYFDNRLVGVGIVDETKDGLSSDYFYYEPSLRVRRFGIFSILKEIEFAIELGKDYLYLGYYIEEIPKMNYKVQFKPYELMIGEKWQGCF